MDVTETMLPGVGLRFDFTLESGRRIGIVAHRTGRFEVAVYSREDPDATTASLGLTEQEADVIAEILGAARIAERFADLTKEIPGLLSGQVEITADSPFAGRTLGDSRCRTLTGASIVAVVHADEITASPAPGHPLQAGDVLVVIGTDEGIRAVRSLFAG
ncbi:MAG: cation:proton antiporter regulatory subunit [Actinomycetota bacterium]|nr:cation:proton antiporter regulatory subunit [Actinomycetota bacterium]